MTQSAVPALPAATVLLVQDVSGGIEVLMVRRRSRGFFGGLFVFPGGAVEDEDSSALARSVGPGSHEDLEYRVAALRELAEEVGLLLTGAGAVPSPEGRGESLYRALHSKGLGFDPNSLVLVSRWVTPETAPRRYDTWFYIAETVNPPPVRLDLTELVEHVWVSPAEALEKHEVGDWMMFLPTVAHLRWLSKRVAVDDALASAQGAESRSLVEPKRLEDGSIVPILVPGETP